MNKDTYNTTFLRLYDDYIDRGMSDRAATDRAESEATAQCQGIIHDLADLARLYWGERK